MKYFLYALALLILGGLQIGVFSQLKVFSVAPNLLLLMVFVLGIQQDVGELFFVAFFGGLMLDFYTGLFLGTFTLPFLIIAVFLNASVSEFFVQELHWKYVFGGLTLTVILCNLLVWLYGNAEVKMGLTSLSIPFIVFKYHIIPEILYNILLLYPVYFAVQVLKLAVVRVGRNSR